MYLHFCQVLDILLKYLSYYILCFKITIESVSFDGAICKVFDINICGLQWIPSKIDPPLTGSQWCKNHGIKSLGTYYMYFPSNQKKLYIRKINASTVFFFKYSYPLICWSKINVTYNIWFIEILNTVSNVNSIVVDYQCLLSQLTWSDYYLFPVNFVARYMVFRFCWSVCLFICHTMFFINFLESTNKIFMKYYTQHIVLPTKTEGEET